MIFRLFESRCIIHSVNFNRYNRKSMKNRRLMSSLSTWFVRFVASEINRDLLTDFCEMETLLKRILTSMGMNRFLTVMNYTSHYFLFSFFFEVIWTWSSFKYWNSIIHILKIQMYYRFWRQLYIRPIKLVKIKTAWLWRQVSSVNFFKRGSISTSTA